MNTELKPYIGRSVEAYMRGTNTIPTAPEGAYNLANGNRMFVFQQSGLATMPGYAAGGIYVPTVAGTVTCTRAVEGKPLRPGASIPADYEIVSITASGC
jgi:hypothetical protein